MTYDVDYARLNSLKEAIALSYFKEHCPTGEVLRTTKKSITKATALTEYQIREAVKALEEKHTLERVPEQETLQFLAVRMI